MLRSSGKRQSAVLVYFCYQTCGRMYVCVSPEARCAVWNSEMLAVGSRRAGVRVETLSPTNSREGPRPTSATCFSELSNPSPLRSDKTQAQRPVSSTVPRASLWQNRDRILDPYLCPCDPQPTSLVGLALAPVNPLMVTRAAAPRPGVPPVNRCPSTRPCPLCPASPLLAGQGAQS